MKDERRWWDGPWPWLVYLVTYGIPWLWVPPSVAQLALSASALGLFLIPYFRSFRLRGPRLLVAICAMVAIGLAVIPLGGGWSILAVFPAMQAARIRPRRTAVWAVVGCILAFLGGGLLSGQPLVWWLPSLLVPALMGGAALSREAFYDRTRALLATQEEVRRLAGTAERERMARDLHDVIGRTLTLVALKADLVARVAGRDPAKAAEEGRAIAEQARAGLADIRAALSGDAGGSLAKELAASAQALGFAGVDAEIQADAAIAPPDAGALLAMTLREAVTNVIRHASASQCRIVLAADERTLMLTVSDDGVGGPIAEGNGLTGMRQRLTAAGGTLVVTSAQGTRLAANVPL